MKLRIKGNTIRLRLLRSEIEKLRTDGRVVDETSFGANALRYSLVESKEAEKIHAQFEGSEITIVIPSTSAATWTSSEQVGFETQQDVGHGMLTIIIEKDFVCLDRPDDPDRADAYPNPNSECAI